MAILRRNPGEYIRAFESILSGPVLQSLATTVRRGKADFATELVRGASSMRAAVLATLTRRRPAGRSRNIATLCPACLSCPVWPVLGAGWEWWCPA